MPPSLCLDLCFMPRAISGCARRHCVGLRVKMVSRGRGMASSAGEAAWGRGFRGIRSLLQAAELGTICYQMKPWLSTFVMLLHTPHSTMPPSTPPLPGPLFSNPTPFLLCRLLTDFPGLLHTSLVSYRRPDFGSFLAL